MATGSSVCTFSPAACSRQSIMSFQKRLSGGRRSVQALGPALGFGLGGLGGRGRGALSRRVAHRIAMDGVDVTPRPLHDMALLDDRPPVTNAWDLLAGLSPSPGLPGPPHTGPQPFGPAVTVHPAPSACSGMGVAVTRDSSVATGSLMGLQGLAFGLGQGIGNLGTSVPASSALSVLSALDDQAPSQFALPRVASIKASPLTSPDTPVSVILSETPTIWLLDQPSFTAPVDTEEAEAIAADNAHREDYLSGVHTFNSVEVQTAAIWVRSRGTNLARVRRKNAAVQATPWDIFDAEHGGSAGSFPPAIPVPAAQPQAAPPATPSPAPQQQPSPVDRRAVQRRRRMLRRTVLDRISSQRSLSLSDADTRSVDSKDESKDDAKDETQDERLRVVLLLPSFRRAALQVERILAACEFRAQQVLYRGIPASDPLAADLRFEYHLEPLWHLEGEWAAGRAVTCLTWNKENTDLLAVGYGKYLQQDQATGLVCMWSAKNPKLPERLYRFASPVSALSFCGTRPNLLAVGMCNGGLALLDVSATEKSVVADAGDGSESGVASPSWEPIWSMEWMSGQEFLTGDEQVLVTAGQDGRVVRWRRGERGLEWTPMLRVAMAEGGEKGVPPLLEASGHCPEREVGLRQFAAVLCMAPVPNDPVRYMVATEDGCVHTCSTNYLQRHKAVVAAHAGPVYRLSFSPFCEKIFLTCGADWTVRIWAVGLDEPLVTLTGGMQSVEDAVWSPRNSTILASISGDDVCMWDLRRKTYLPASRTAWPHPSPPTTLLFSPGQDNLLVGDREGRVAALALQHMPFAPYFQTKALVASLERALATKPALLAALKKRGEPFV